MFFFHQQLSKEEYEDHLNWHHQHRYQPVQALAPVLPSAKVLRDEEINRQPEVLLSRPLVVSGSVPVSVQLPGNPHPLLWTTPYCPAQSRPRTKMATRYTTFAVDRLLTIVRSLFCANIVFQIYQIVCYYTNWSQYRTKLGKFQPEDIQPDLCTHIIFAFGWLKKGRLSSFESNDETKDGKTGLYDRINSLKKANPKLKILLAIGEFINFIVMQPKNYSFNMWCDFHLQCSTTVRLYVDDLTHFC